MGHAEAAANIRAVQKLFRRGCGESHVFAFIFAQYMHNGIFQKNNKEMGVLLDAKHD